MGRPIRLDPCSALKILLDCTGRVVQSSLITVPCEIDRARYFDFGGAEHQYFSRQDDGYRYGTAMVSE